jgi:23S rRNA (adenine2503-C2)-methyltransferase
MRGVTAIGTKENFSERERTAGGRISLLGLTCGALGGFLHARRWKAYRAEQIFRWIYREGILDPLAMTNLPLEMREALAADFHSALPVCVRQTGARDTTRKFLFRLGDGQAVETVMIPASPSLYGSRADRLTLCVSSQVGCAYGCKFCASGLDGWKRNLSADEIVGQVLACEQLAGETVSNLVFMGMGEPFANYENLMTAIEILNARWGRALGARHMTVSTSGLVPKIREFADQPLQVRLAISLHGATDAVRGRIMPVNKRYPLAGLFDACEYFASRKKQRITFEYILISGVNDSMEQARALAGHASRLRAKVNLIPYNSVDGLDWVRPRESDQHAFLKILRDRGVPATLRIEKGHDIAAACGQLRLRDLREKSLCTTAGTGLSVSCDG